MTSRDPITPSTIPGEDLRVAADAVDFERRTERMQVISRALGAIVVVVVVVVVAAVVLLRKPHAPLAAVARDPDSGQQAALLEFIGTADEGRTAQWAYLRANADVVDVVRATADSRESETLASLPREGDMGDTALLAKAHAWQPPRGPAPEPLAFTQNGEDVAVVVDGATRHLQWTLWDEPCSAEQRGNLPIKNTRQWRLCADTGRCIEAPVLHKACLSAPPALVALHRSGDVLWVIAERSFKSRNVPRMAAGGVMPELFASK
jgi:hypothetical protein